MPNHLTQLKAIGKHLATGRKEGKKRFLPWPPFFFFVVMVRADKWPIGSLLAATLHVSFLTQFFSEIDEMQEGMLSTKNSEFPKPTMC